MITTRTVDAITILDLHGPLGAGKDDVNLRTTIRLAFEGGAKHVVLNMQHVPGIDSSGVAALASAHMTAVNRGGTLRLCNLPQKLKDVFAIMRLNTVFNSNETEAEAIASAQAPPS